MQICALSSENPVRNKKFISIRSLILSRCTDLTMATGVMREVFGLWLKHERESSGCFEPVYLRFETVSLEWTTSMAVATVLAVLCRVEGELKTAKFMNMRNDQTRNASGEWLVTREQVAIYGVCSVQPLRRNYVVYTGVERDQQSSRKISVEDRAEG